MKMIVSVILLFGVLGCGDDPVAPDITSYTLVSIDGEPLPITVADNGTTRVQFTGGRINLDRDGTFSDRIELRFTTNGVEDEDSDTIGGTYTLNGTTIRFDYQGDGPVVSGTLERATLTQHTSDGPWVYER